MRWYFVISQLFLWGIQNFLSGQLPIQPRDYHFGSITTREGLPQNNVSCLAQDHFGFMWIGTQLGASRYNGTDFIDHQELKTVNSIFEDSDSLLWIGTEDGLFYFEEKSGSFRLEERNTPASTEGKEITGITEFENQIIVSTPKSIYALVDKKVVDSLRLVSPVMLVFAEKLFIGSSEGLLVCGEGDSFSEAVNWSTDPVTALAKGEKGIYTGGLNHKMKIPQILHYYPDRSVEQIPSDKIEGEIGALLYDFREAILWIGTQRGKLYFSAPILEGIEKSYLELGAIKSLYQSQNGMIWVGTESKGIRTFDPFSNIFGRILLQDSLGLTKMVWSILRDRMNVLWLGTSNGLYFVKEEGSERPKKVPLIYMNEGKREKLTDQIVLAISIDPLGNLWVGTRKRKTDDGLLLRFEICGEGHLKPGELIAKNMGRIKTIVHANDVTWVGSRTKGLWKVTKDGKVVIPIKNWTRKESSPSQVYVIKKDPTEDQILWIGTIKRGFYRFRTDSLVGVSCDLKGSKIDNNVVSIALHHEVNDNYILYGTQGGGLWKYLIEDDTTVQIEHFNGKTVYGMEKGNGDSIWLASNDGLYLFDLKEDTILREFKMGEQVHLGEFNAGGSYCDRLGNIFFGGDIGLIKVPGKGIQQDNYIPKVYFESIFVDLKKVDPDRFLGGGDIVKLPRENNSLLLKLGITDFSFPHNNNFELRVLEGGDSVDIPYQELGNFFILSFPRPGDYSVYFRSVTPDGEKSEDAFLKVKLEGPTWAEKYYSILVIIILIGIPILIFIYIESKKIKRSRKNLEDEKNEKERIIKEKEELAKLTKKITYSKDRVSLFRQIYSDTLDKFGIKYDTICIAIYDPENEELVFEHLWENGSEVDGKARYSVRTENPSLSVQSLLNDEVIFIDDLEKEYSKWVKEMPTPQVGKSNQSVYFYPLVAKTAGESKKIGVFTVQSSHKNAFTEQDKEVLEVLSDFLVITLDNNLSLSRQKEKYRAMSHTFAHEIKYLSSTLTQNWIKAPDTFFEIVIEEEPSYGSQKFGKIFLSKEDSGLLEGMAFIPIKEFVLTLGKQISFWTGKFDHRIPLLENWKNSSGIGELEGRFSLECLVQACWGFAKEIMCLSILSRRLIDNKDDFENLRTHYIQLFSILPPKVDITFSDLSEVKDFYFDLNSKDGDYLDKVMMLSRLFAAMFTNLIKHFDPSLPVTMELKEAPGKEEALGKGQRIALTLDNFKRENPIEIMADRIKMRWANENIPEEVHGLSSETLETMIDLIVDTGMNSFQGHVSFSSREVFKELLEDDRLNGSLSPDREIIPPTNSHYRLQCFFQIPTQK